MGRKRDARADGVPDGAHDGTADGPDGARDVDLVHDERGGVTLHVDGDPQSHVQPDDPTLLVFEYVQHLALAIGTLPDGPLAVTHVGGAAMTLPRWVEATRPGSPQVVLEPDAWLTELVRRELPLPRRHRIRVRPQDGATGVRALADASADVVVTDAYARGRVPAELTHTDYVADVARVVRPGGLALWNLADEPARRYVARVLATVRLHLPHVAVVATHEVLKGRRFGNTVVVAGHRPLPLDELRRAAARAPLPTGVRAGAELERSGGGALPFVDDRETSPPPPVARGWRVV